MGLHEKVAWDIRRVVLVHQFHIESVSQRDRLEDCLDVMIAIGPAADNIQSEVYFAARKSYHCFISCCFL